MTFTVEIPDELANRITGAPGDLSRRALEALALDAYQNGDIREHELQRILGFGTRYQLDGFLKARNVLIENYSIEDLHQEVQTLQRLGF